jgi:GDP-mannose pyrophosphatase NudK
MADIIIKDQQVLHDGHINLKKVSYQQKGKNGRPRNLEREVVSHGNAVGVLLYNAKEKKVLLTRQFRLTAYLNGHPSGYILEACAGLAEEGEDPMETLKREVEEETGYAIEEVEKIGQVYASLGILTELVYLFIAPYRSNQKKSKGGGLKEEGEDIETVELSFEEATRLVQQKEIVDAKTLILLQHLMLRNLLG